MKQETFINENRPHESAIKHVSGKAYYTDDIPEPPGTLFGAIGWSKKAHAIIKKINLDKVIKSEGVVAVITADDIPGRNDVGRYMMVIQYFQKKLSIMVSHFLLWLQQQQS